MYIYVHFVKNKVNSHVPPHSLRNRMFLNMYLRMCVLNFWKLFLKEPEYLLVNVCNLLNLFLMWPFLDIYSSYSVLYERILSEDLKAFIEFILKNKNNITEDIYQSIPLFAFMSLLNPENHWTVAEKFLTQDTNAV